MSPFVVVVCYGSAIGLALAWLWYSGPKNWYLHLLSIAAAVGIGSVPLTGYWSTPEGTLRVGWAFLFLLFWGLGGVALSAWQHEEHWRLRHH
jgi:hypothetical protein